MSGKSKKRKIVIVEDDPQVCRLIPNMFALSGFDIAIVTGVSSIEQLVKGKAHKDADFFVCDVMMPHGLLYTQEETCDGCYTGILVARDLRAKYPNVPIILWSSFPLEAVRAMAKQATSVISKCALVGKSELPKNLIKAIDHYFKTGRFKRGVFERLWGAISLRPSIPGTGVGIDLKALG
jgi:CheY-like chemotaxis protein